MKKIFFIITALVLVIPSLVLADGMIMPPPDYYMYESDQKAVIFYENDLETLILSITFRGNANDFAWLVPTPARPKVSKASDELFTSLDELTQLRYDLERPAQLGVGFIDTAVPKKVYIIETKKIDYYNITVLAATNASELVKWLNENGYQFPEASTYLLEDYINNGWVFTAVKIDTSSLSWQVENQLKTGHATPLKLEFRSDKIIYPLKVSSVVVDYQPPLGGSPPIPLPGSSEVISRRSVYYQPPDYVNILLYVITDHKQTLPGFNTQYAGYIKKDVIEKLAYNDDGTPWIKVSKNKYYLTKLYRQMQRSEMTHDLILRQAENDETVNAPTEVKQSWVPFAIITGLGGFVTLLLVIILIWQAAIKEKTSN